MLNLGKFNTLTVVNKLDDSYILDYGVKLFFKEVLDEEVEVGDKIKVFVYNDVEKGVLGTLRPVYGEVGELCLLRVVDTGVMGAFLDLGLEKDVLLLKNKMETDLNVDDEIIVLLTLDNKNRIGATMRISDYLEIKEGVKKEDRETGIVYRVNEDMGIFIAIDGKYHGFIHKNKLTKEYKVGEEVEGTVVQVRPDGKIELSIKDIGTQAIDGDAKIIYDYILDNDGKLDINDKSDPDLIKRKVGLSKKAFKKALGRLYKEGRVIKVEDSFKINYKKK